MKNSNFDYTNPIYLFYPNIEAVDDMFFKAKGYESVFIIKVQRVDVMKLNSFTTNHIILFNLHTLILHFN